METADNIRPVSAHISDIDLTRVTFFDRETFLERTIYHSIYCEMKNDQPSL